MYKVDIELFRQKKNFFLCLNNNIKKFFYFMFLLTFSLLSGDGSYRSQLVPRRDVRKETRALVLYVLHVCILPPEILVYRTHGSVSGGEPSTTPGPGQWERPGVNRGTPT